eukprot:CAMPEP_0198429936 /NCGR_PEP_ID=MMETSP1452-20131203/10688_1 /TAXON_ID=1181717 /ORGANISM="Synchroma pusillum, Strain CCMP3072" /LENGTH=174 /DNA_ID=CAMNT_0044150359 /DNA_START=121 /DNA_END=641 /DNA_ORIENTATION=+
MVEEISSNAAFNAAIATPSKLVVVDFFATWCGPCKRIAPALDAMASSGAYSDVRFIKVPEHLNQELIMSLGVRAFPTFFFYINGQKVDEMRGANERGLVDKIETLRRSLPPPAFSGSGATLGGTPGGPAVDPREARLRRLGGGTSAAPAPSAGASNEAMAKMREALMASAAAAG